MGFFSWCIINERERLSASQPGPDTQGSIIHFSLHCSSPLRTNGYLKRRLKVIWGFTEVISGRECFASGNNRKGCRSEFPTQRVYLLLSQLHKRLLTWVFLFLFSICLRTSQLAADSQKNNVVQQTWLFHSLQVRKTGRHTPTRFNLKPV